MMNELMKSYLFLDMTKEDIENCIECSGAKTKTYEKNHIIFTELDPPSFLYVLIEGSVAVCKDSISGKRGIITTIEESGDIFGEVYLFIGKNDYDFYTITNKETTILEIPKEFFYHTCTRSCNHHSKLISNMLRILAQKAYFLSQKLQVLSSGNIRQKVAKYLLENQITQNRMNREEFADFLNVARPSLSRELIKMQDEGLISVKGKELAIINFEKLEDCL